MWAIERGGVMREGEIRPTTADLRLHDMDRDGADVSVMYGPTEPMVITDAELRRRCYEAYNAWLSDFCMAKPERLIGVAQLSMEDPQSARDELERLSKRGGVRHVNILASRAPRRSTMKPGSHSGRWRKKSVYRSDFTSRSL